MADGTPAFEIPAGAVPLIRSVSVTATGGGSSNIIYTLNGTTGQRVVILAAWVSAVNAGATPGSATITAFPEFDSAARTLVGVNLPAGATSANAVNCCIPTTSVGNTNILMVEGLPNTSTIVAGISGYLEATEK